VYPALAILTAFLIVKAMDGHSSVAFGFLAIGTLIAATRATLSVVVLFSVLIAFVVFFLLIYKRSIYRPLTVLMLTFLMVTGLEAVWPLYTQNEEPIAQLARMAGSVSSEDREPLLVYSGIDAPTPLFYSDRPIIEVQTENDLVAYCNVNRPTKILFAKADIVSLAKYCELQVVADSGSLIYGTIQQKR